METRLTKVGNSVAVRLSRDVLQKARLGEGDLVRVDVGPGRKLVVRSVQRASKRKRITLKELLRGLRAENRVPEVDWGPSVGKERT